MASQSKPITYSREFVGNLLGHQEPVPVRMYTRLRIMTEGEARELKCRGATGTANCVFHPDEDLPMHPSLLAMTRHQFSW